ncbi:MAG: shikimate kinase [Acidimicrobiales bacterium]
MRHLVLIGLPGVGKSTVAALLAERWATKAIDTDAIVAAAVGMSAAQFLRDEGEKSFRARELEALTAVLADEHDSVIATGGGIVSTPQARAVLAEEFVLWLDCDDDVILARLGDVERPLLAEDPSASLARLRAERESWYREVSHARIETATSLEDVVAQITREVDRLTR